MFQFGRRKKNKRSKTSIDQRVTVTEEPQDEAEEEEDDEDGGDMSKYKLDSDEVRTFFPSCSIIHSGFEGIVPTLLVPTLNTQPKHIQGPFCIGQKGVAEISGRLPSEGDCTAAVMFSGANFDLTDAGHNLVYPQLMLTKLCALFYVHAFMMLLMYIESVHNYCYLCNNGVLKGII